MLVRTIFAAAFLFLSFSTTAQKADSVKHSLSLQHEQNHFDNQFADPWYSASIQYGHHFSQATVLGKINYANRFKRNGLQVEAEAYPKFGKGWYAFTGLAYSNDLPVFSRWRTGASLFIPFAKGWEGEAGFRHLYFTEAIWIGTAGLSKYLGSWLLNLRSFFSPDAPTQDASFFLNTRRYLRNEKDYLWLQLGRGISPDESRNVQLNADGRLTSHRISSGAKISFSHTLQWQLSLGWSKDQYAAGKEGNQIFGNTGFEFSFR